MNKVITMKIKTNFGLVIIVVFLFILLSGCVQSKCGDGICQPREERKGSCSQDCEKISPIEPPVEEDLCIVKSIEAIGEGAFPQWSAKSNLIAFNKEVNGAHEIFTMSPEGNDVNCLTCGRSELPLKGHKGQPVWHISGDYLVFTAENTDYPKLRLGLNAYPDCGRNHNVWIMSADGNMFWQMTDYEENWGVIRPRFSPDETMLFWSEEWGMEKYPGSGSAWSVSINPEGEKLGLWRIRIADISFSTGVPILSDQRTVYHEELSLLEGSGFTPDGKKIHFSSAPLADTKGIAFWGEIYISDLNGKNLIRLTNTPYQHDENSEISPDGTKIVWSHSDGSPGEAVDLYIMDIDGKNTTRITYFSDEVRDEKHRCNELAWSPDGKQIALAFGKGDDHAEEISMIYMLTFEGACGNSR
ncbi:PD40 domain-containing protein [bacterium]|nr:PD40 domain-containing protein [bacterium]